MKWILILVLLFGIAADAADVQRPMTEELALEVLAHPSVQSDEVVKDAAKWILQVTPRNDALAERLGLVLVQGIYDANTEDACLSLLSLASGDVPDLNRAVASTISRVSTTVTVRAIEFLAGQYWLDQLGGDTIGNIIDGLSHFSASEREKAVTILGRVTHLRYESVKQWQEWWLSARSSFSLVRRALEVAVDRNLPLAQRSFALRQATYQLLHGPDQERAKLEQAEKTMLSMLHDPAEIQGFRTGCYRDLLGIYKEIDPKKGMVLLKSAVEDRQLRAAAFMDLRGEPDLLQQETFQQMLLGVALDAEASRIDRACASLALSAVRANHELPSAILKVAMDLRGPPEKADQAFRISLVALRELTGQDFGDNFEKWRAWIE
ncbi:MAG: hypothetical protein HY646_14275, partial [Acidobacteria bacterium]|nr:hypothetical protein [Acidobacteriota bacterium]